jgi:arylsulfatase A-like enzyme
MQRLLITLITLSIALSLQAQTKPNIVFILIDDLRWNTLGCMGDEVVKTPNIDRLAQRGTVFRNAFVTTSICWVSRASIFSGQWSRRHGVEQGSENLKSWEQTYPTLLRANGYRTGFIGKFGVGNPKEIAKHEAEFDFWQGLPGQGGKFFIDPKDPTRTHTTAKMGNHALEFLKGCDSSKPFSLSISFNAVHARDHEPREYEPDLRDEMLYEETNIPRSKLATEEAFARLPAFVQNSEGRTRWKWRFDSAEKAQSILRDYYRLISGVDREVGRITEQLEKQHLTENTIIVVTSDNGYSLGDRGLADKWFMYEEDIRVPSIIMDPRQPEKVRGQKRDEMVLNVDFAATMLDWAGVRAPATMQGRSLAPLIKGDSPTDWRTEFFYEHHSVPDRIPPVEGVRTERWKYIRWVTSSPLVEEFYDLKNDPLEEKNLLTDKANTKELEELRAKWERYQQTLK